MSGPAARIPLSVVVMTRDEAANIGGCLGSLGPFAEVFVVDSGSRDGTAEAAARAGARVVPFRWNGRYPKKKQWCLDSLPFSHDWVLFVDADERVPPALAAELAALLRRGPDKAAYLLDSRPVVLGRVLRFGARYRKVALLHRRHCRFPPCPDLGVTTMWEVEGHYQPVVAGPVGRLRSALLHDDAKPPFAWFERHNRYSDWEAHLDHAGGRSALLAGEGPRRRLLKRLFRRLPCRPFLLFLLEYGVRLGFLDGRAGLHHALARAFYYWQVGYKRDWLAAREGRAGGAQSSESSSSTSPASALISSNARRRTGSSGMR